MSLPHDTGVLSSSPKPIRKNTPSPIRHRRSESDGPERVSPTMTRSFHLDDPDARERQRTLDVDMAMQLSRARSQTVSSPVISPVSLRPPHLSDDHTSPYPDTDIAQAANIPLNNHTEPFQIPHHQQPTPLQLPHLNQTHDPSLIATFDDHAHVGSPGNILSAGAEDESLAGLPMYQPSIIYNRFNFDFDHMEDWAKDEKQRLGIRSGPSTPGIPINHKLPQMRHRPSQQKLHADDTGADASHTAITLPPDPRTRQRKLSQSAPHPRSRPAGKMALFEGQAGAPPPSLSGPRPGPSSGYDNNRDRDIDQFGAGPSDPGANAPGIGNTGHDRPYRFSFYSNALSATIHARTLSELPAEHQTFESLFSGIVAGAETDETPSQSHPSTRSQTPYGTAKDNNVNNKRGLGGGIGGLYANGGINSNLNSKVAFGANDSKAGSMGPNGILPLNGDPEGSTWWLDVLAPTDEEMKMLSKVFGIHPLTTEDIQMEETREKIELFRNYYFVCFRSFDQDPYSPTYLEPLNTYVVVFREGTISFHFRPTPHPSNVRRRIKQLKDYISVTSDWISYALIDDITDAFGPLIQSIEYEVDSIDELVLILKEAEQSDMLRRIGTCRKKVMGLLRLMGNKADVVKGLAKRCNENWRVAPTSDIGLYLSDIQDHLITMTQNLNHYEKILSRSHSNYLAQISIEMTDANNQINDVLSKLTALGTVLIPMNLVTGLWGMNVHVPGQDVPGYAWFLSIIGVLLAFAVIGGYSTYKLMAGR